MVDCDDAEDATIADESGCDEDLPDGFQAEPKPKEIKKSIQELKKFHDDLMEKYMRGSLKKYNNEQNLDEDLAFEFVKVVKESLIVEGGFCNMMFYRHFNFEAMQSGTSICLFFAEVIQDAGDFEVTCCKIVGDDDSGTCLGCKNQGDPNLKHPAAENVYVGGHVDSRFPFLIDSDSEDDTD